MLNPAKMRTRLHTVTVNALNKLVRETWRLPAYQRGLVWAPEQALDLVRSINDGYPIGSMLVWAPTWSEGILLDGQQRSAAVTGVRCGGGCAGPQVGWSLLDEQWLVEADPEDEQFITIKWWFETDSYDKIMHLNNMGVELTRNSPWGRMLNAFDRLEWSEIPVHVLDNASPAEAAEAFRRLNTMGTPIDHNELNQLLEQELL